MVSRDEHTDGRDDDDADHDGRDDTNLGLLGVIDLSLILLLLQPYYTIL